MTQSEYWELLSAHNIESAVKAGGICMAERDEKRPYSTMTNNTFYSYDLDLKLKNRGIPFSIFIREYPEGSYRLSGPGWGNACCHMGIFKHLESKPNDQEAIDMMRDMARQSLNVILAHGLRYVFCNGGEEAGCWHEWQVGKRNVRSPVAIEFRPTQPRNMIHGISPGWRTLFDPLASTKG